MLKTKIGFVPSHRIPFDIDWAFKLRNRTIKELKKIPGLELVVPDERLTKKGLVHTIEEAEKVRDLFIKEKVSGVIIGGMTFGHETSAVGVIASGMSEYTPILQFATKGEVRKDGTRPSDSWCGQFMITSALQRRNIVFEHIPTCFPEEPIFNYWAERFTRACQANEGFRGARLGQIGARPEEFESVWWDEASLQKNFRQTVVPVDLDDFLARVEAIPKDDSELKKIISEIGKDLTFSKEISQNVIPKMARIEKTLLQLAQEKGLSAMGVNCWTRVQERIGTCVCAVLGRVTSKGIMCSCEVDIYGAATMLAAYLSSLGRVPPHFIDWTELHPKEPNVFLAWHCGNAPVCLAAKGCKPELKGHSILILPGKDKGTGEFRLKSGEVTCARLVEYDGEFTMFVGKGEVIDIPPKVRGSYGWVKVKDINDWESKMVENGIIHHGVLLPDPLVADALESFCKFNRIKVVKGC